MGSYSGHDKQHARGHCGKPFALTKKWFHKGAFNPENARVPATRVAVIFINPAGVHTRSGPVAFAISQE